MSPTELQTLAQQQQQQQPTILINGQALPDHMQPERVQTTQPEAAAPMDPQRPHADDDEANIRGGERSGMCPGRFCFIIPCPLPCDCCII